MKGLLKGLRYISQIFEAEKEPEMQIGYPTDVKHVAHIGWDGPSVNSPSWMNEFKSSNPELSAGPLNYSEEVKETAATKLSSEDINRTSLGLQNLVLKNYIEMRNSTRHHPSSSNSSPYESPSQSPSVLPKQSQRRNSPSISSPVRDLLDGTKPSRRHQKSNLGVDLSPSRDSLASPRQGRRRKSKGSSGSGSSRSSQSKNHNPLTNNDPYYVHKTKSNDVVQSNSVLQAFEEEKCVGN